MGETPALIALALFFTACGVGIGFELGRMREQRRREREQDARVRRLMRDIKSAPVSHLWPSYWSNHPLYHANSFATIDQLIGTRIVEPPND